MKFQVAKQDLENALAVVNASLGGGNPADISNHILFRARQGDNDEWKAEALTYTGRLCAGAPFVAKVEVKTGGPTAFTIEGARLKELLKFLPDAALEFEFDGANTTYRGPGGQHGTLKFRSLDPKKYPFWDDTLAEANVVAKIPAPGLRRAINWARMFVLDDETRRPDLSVFESRKGVIHATNTKSVALVTVPGMEESVLRVHGGDASKIVSFLDTVGDGEVEVLESELALYLRRPDGAVFGETRFNVKFPDNLKMGKIDSDPRWWEIPIADLKTSMGILGTVADRDDTRLRFKPGTGDTVELEMALESGESNGRQIMPLVNSGEEADAPPVPDVGFLLDRNELKRLLSVHEGDNIRIGLHPRGKSGFVRFAYKIDNVSCQIILAWLRE